jgi:hypothetical protein
VHAQLEKLLVRLPKLPWRLLPLLFLLFGALVLHALMDESDLVSFFYAVSKVSAIGVGNYNNSSRRVTAAKRINLTTKSFNA